VITHNGAVMRRCVFSMDRTAHASDSVIYSDIAHIISSPIYYHYYLLLLLYFYALGSKDPLG